jgi:apolipoprotein N-acyltransferase
MARVALVHAELENARRQGAATAAAALDRYLALSPAAGTVDLVVWPENAVDLLLEDNPELVARIAARAGATPYLIGAPRSVASTTGPTLRTSALVVEAGGVTGSYDKRRLLPFAETMPSLRGGGAAAPHGFAPGTTATVVTAGRLRLGPLICYEAIFPELARTTVRAGADLLVNLSNDSWFPPGAGPAQHARFVELRAVELRRTLVRAANRGVTMVVLPDGRVPLVTDGATPGVEIAAVPLLTIPTVYARIGDGFAWLCIAVVALGLGGRADRSRVGASGVKEGEGFRVYSKSKEI